MSAISHVDSQTVSALAPCIELLQRLAEYELEPEIARYIRDLGERKEFLSEEEHKGLIAFATLTEERTIDKLAAKIALKRLREAFPELFNGSPV